MDADGNNDTFPERMNYDGPGVGGADDAGIGGGDAPAAAEITVPEVRTARTSEKDAPTAEADALRGGTEEHALTV